MKPKKLRIVLIAVIVALAAYVMLQKGGKTHYTLPELPKIESRDITKLSLKTKDAEIIIEKKGGKWMIEPQGYPADGPAVDGMISNIAGFSLSALVSESESLANYDLDPEHRVEVAAFAGNGVKRAFFVGKAAPSGGRTFVKLDKGAGVYHAEGNLRTAYDTTVSRLRDKTVLKIDEDIKSIVLAQGGNRLKVVATAPGPKGQATSKGKKADKPAEKSPEHRWMTTVGKPANDREVDDLIAVLRNLACDEFIEGEKKTDYSKPSYTITLVGAKTYTLSLFKEKDNSYAALSSESEYPFRLSEWRAKQIMKEFGVLKK